MTLGLLNVPWVSNTNKCEWMCFMEKSSITIKEKKSTMREKEKNGMCE